MKVTTSVYCVILNWNNWKDTLNCLESIFSSSQYINNINITIVLCDNGSTDGSLEIIKNWAIGGVAALLTPKFGNLIAHVSKPVQYVEFSYDDPGNQSLQDLHDHTPLLVLIRIQRNLGYAAGNNVGIRFAMRNNADYIFILNNDTILDKNCIPNLIDFGNRHPDAALMAPRLFEPDRAGSSFSECNPIDWVSRPTFTEIALPSRLKHALSFVWPMRTSTPKDSIPDDILKLYVVTGCAMMFRASTFEQVGLFDEKTFLYYEEFIIAEKLRNACLSTYLVKDAMVLHLKGATTRKLIDADKYIISLVSEKHYIVKYLCITKYQLVLIMSVRISAYVKRMFTDSTYRKKFPYFVKQYFIKQ